MSNRAGKREREARNRHKRGYTSGVSRTGAVLRPLKLGRKKMRAFGSSSTLAVGFAVYGGSLPCHTRRADMAAVPVADAESRDPRSEEPKSHGVECGSRARRD